MPTHDQPSGMLSDHDAIRAAYAALGLLPVTGGSDAADGDDDGDQGDDKGDAKAGAAGSGKGDGKAGDDDGKGGDDAAGLKAALSTERVARREAEKAMKALEKRLADLENAGKTDQQKADAEREKLQKRLDDLDTKHRESAGREAIRLAARKAGAPEENRDLIYRSAKSDLSFDDDGEPENAEQLVKDLKELYGHLFKAPASKADLGNGNKQKPERGDFMRAAIADRRGG